jgi:DNA-binding transcriptional LysR family regulator
MDIKQLNTFLTLCKIKNFTKTAELLGYAQSSITAQIKQLESEMNVKLFERIGKTVTLTPAGKDLIPYATQIVSISSNMKEIISSSDAIHGHISIGVSESLCIYRLPSIIKAYRQQYPDVNLCLKLLNSDQFIPLLSDNTIDIAFAIGDRFDDPAINLCFEIPERILVLSSPESPLAKEAEVTLQALAKEAFILTEPGCRYRKAFEDDIQAAGLKVDVILETGSIQAIKEVAMSGLGLCVLPEIAVVKEVENNSLVPLAYKNNYKIYSQLICHKDKWLSPVLKSFINFVKSYLKEF